MLELIYIIQQQLMAGSQSRWLVTSCKVTVVQTLDCFRCKEQVPCILEPLGCHCGVSLDRG